MGDDNVLEDRDDVTITMTKTSTMMTQTMTMTDVVPTYLLLVLLSIKRDSKPWPDTFQMQ